MKLLKVSDAQKAGIKAVTRRLVGLAGGMESAALTSRPAKASFGYYCHIDHDQFIPADAIADLEADVGDPVVTRELAKLAGYQLVPQSAAAVEGEPAILLARVVKELGEAAAAIDDMDADGRRTPNELDRCVRETQDVIVQANALFDRLHRMRAEAAGVK